MSDNVHHLKVIEGSGPPDGFRPPNDDVIATLELLLDLARQGSVQSLAYVAINRPTDPPATGGVVTSGCRNAAVMGAVMLADDLRWKATVPDA